MVKLFSYLRLATSTALPYHSNVRIRCYHSNVRCFQRDARAGFQRDAHAGWNRVKCCSRTSPIVEQKRSLSDDSVVQFSRAIAEGLSVEGRILETLRTRTLVPEASVRFFVGIMKTLPSSDSARKKLEDMMITMCGCEEGINTVIDMREKCGVMIRRLPEPDLIRFDKILFKVLSKVVTFNTTLITTVNRDSPPEVLAMVKHCDRVHPIQNDTELKHRLADNRSVFILTHDLLPTRPLVMLHVAHSRGMFQCVTDIKDGKDRSTIDTLCRLPDKQTDRQSDSAVDILHDTGNILSCTEFHENSPYKSVNSFYSISSLEVGLKGIPCGGWCISKAKEVLAASQTIYSTLSPVPGFKDWLDVSIKRGSSTVIEALGEDMCEMKAILSPAAPAVPPHLQDTIVQLAAYYLLKEKQRGNVLDPVCHFHVGNGAVVWGLRWGGTRSKEMQAQSLGLMVNYLYDSESPVRAAQYSKYKAVVVGEAVRSLLGTANQSTVF